MTLRTWAGKQIQRILLDTDELAESVTYKPDNDATGASLDVVVHDSQQVAILDAGSDVASDTVDCLAHRQDLRDLINTIEGAERDGRRGDVVVFPSASVHAGTWYVDDARPDQLGGLTLSLTRARAVRVAADGALEG